MEARQLIATEDQNGAVARPVGAVGATVSVPVPPVPPVGHGAVATVTVATAERFCAASTASTPSE